MVKILEKIVRGFGSIAGHTEATVLTLTMPFYIPFLNLHESSGIDGFDGEYFRKINKAWFRVMAKLPIQDLYRMVLYGQRGNEEKIERLKQKYPDLLMPRYESNST